MTRIRSINEIGSLWPRCARCKHIAQEHNNHDGEPGRGCGAPTRGQCPTCKQYTNDAECQCRGYVGPTLEQFKADYLTPEEIEHHKM
jgi:hypothetical protein